MLCFNVKKNLANSLSLTDEFNWFALQQIGEVENFTSLNVKKSLKLLIGSAVQPEISLTEFEEWATKGLPSWQSAAFVRIWDIN